MKKIIFSMSKGNTSSERILEQLKRMFKNSLEEMHKCNIISESQKKQGYQKLKDLKEEDFQIYTGFCFNFTDPCTYVINQLNNVIVATSGEIDILRRVSKNHTSSDLKYEEVVSKYFEYTFNCDTKKLLEKNPYAETIENLYGKVSNKVIETHIENCMNDLIRYIPKNELQSLLGIFKKDKEKELLKWLNEKTNIDPKKKTNKREKNTADVDVDFKKSNHEAILAEIKKHYEKEITPKKKSKEKKITKK
jgi:copper chaperone CopZ